jgi:uncharacterized protein involved in exopolysaccharide biosynthesis
MEGNDVRPQEGSSATGQATAMAPVAANSSRLAVEGVEPGPNRVQDDEARAARERTATLLRALWEQRLFLLRMAGAGLALSTLAAFLIQKEYQSTTRLMPPDQVNSSMAMLAAASGTPAGSGLGAVAGNLLGLKSTGALFVAILQSRTVEDDVIDRLDLRKIYGVREWSNARNVLEDHTSVSEDRKSGIITIEVTDRSAQRAAAMGQEYVEELNRVVTGLNTSSAHRERLFLEERLAQVKVDLETAEKRFSEYSSKNTAIDIQAQGKAMIEAAAALEGQLIVAKTELQSLKQIYTDGNVRVRATQARVDELQSQLQRLGGKPDSGTAAPAENDKPAYPSIRELPLLGVSYADLYRATKVQEAIFETLTREYELAKVEEAKETPSVKMIDPPNVPENRSFPPRVEIMLFGTLLAASLGVMWVFTRRAWEKTDSRDPQKVLALEVFQTAKAHLPWASQNGFGVRDASRRLWSHLRRRELDNVQ